MSDRAAEMAGSIGAPIRGSVIVDFFSEPVIRLR